MGKNHHPKRKSTTHKKTAAQKIGGLQTQFGQQGQQRTHAAKHATARLCERVQRWVVSEVLNSL